jgi:isopentenyl phosphate kinase
MLVWEACSSRLTTLAISRLQPTFSISVRFQPHDTEQFFFMRLRCTKATKCGTPYFVAPSFRSVKFATKTMTHLIFIKLGGSLITDKTQRYHARREVIARLGHEIAAALRADPELRILLGHGSGSFGHVAARESGYERKRGHASPLALAQVATAASALNQIVREELVQAGVPVVSIAPSATGVLENGTYHTFAVDHLHRLLAYGAVPLVYGDVALGTNEKGGIASTEMVFDSLARAMHPTRLYLAGIVDGVFQSAPGAGLPNPPLIPEIAPHNWMEIQAGLGGSHGTDVTGGMLAKVRETLALVEAVEGLEARIINGETEGLLERLLLNPSLPAGTTISKV